MKISMSKIYHLSNKQYYAIHTITYYIETCESLDLFICISKNISQRRPCGSLLLVSKEMTWYQRKFVNLKIVWNVSGSKQKFKTVF